jgi:hypothetical protein
MEEQNSDPFDADARREAAVERQNLDRIQLEHDLRATMLNEPGRRVVWSLLVRLGMWRSSFTGERQGTDFREGMRNAALMLWDDLEKACPDLLLRMLKENRK